MSHRAATMVPMPSTTSSHEPSQRAPRLRVVASASEPPSPATATRFSACVRTVVALSRQHGLRAPVFRSPPRIEGVDRTIRRRPGGTAVVSVRRSGRPLAAVQADVIEGVIAANGLQGAAADGFRREAWAALEGPHEGRGAPGHRRATMVAARPARVA